MLNLLLQARRRGGHTLTSRLLQFGAGGLFVVAIIDSSPIPTFAGPDILTILLAANHREFWYVYAAIATAGSVLGAYFTYRLARKAGQAYIDKKFKKKGKVASVMKVYQRWGAGALFASCAVPFPFPTGVLFAVAGVSKYRLPKFLGIVSAGRALRYAAVAFIAGHYGRHILRVFRHPGQYWGWLVSLVLITAALVTAFFLLQRRFASAPAEPIEARQ
ncbi:MAG TPA: VTT domain-containing protein [Phycisphaerae bacterium]|nr:VTT domain-containing protein [Phycisphaerae bacterium]